MPSRSRQQQKLMHAAAKKKGGAGGVPQRVAKDYVANDHARGAKKLPKRVKKKT